MKEYISYLDIAKKIELPEGAVVYLSSELIQIALLAERNGETFDADALIDSFLQVLGKRGTLCIPTFNFDFSNYGFYDYKNSKGTTGALGNCALKHKEFRRTKHPIHSFAVAGLKRDEYCYLDNKNSFGTDSIFQRFYDQNAIQIILGTDYQRAMTFIHYVEMMETVPYRYMKEFKGDYVNEWGEERKVKIDYYVRDLQNNPIERFNRIGKILEKKGVSKVYTVNGVVIYKIDLHKSYPIIAEDICDNKSKNLYDFNCSTN